MHINKYLTILIFLLSILIVTSCKLLSPDDTTPPEIQLTIAGGNEISRGVTLYLDIKDDSKIDYVSVIIDDTTAITVESNFNTISFDVTPFADESEHILYVIVEDSEGNIGESEKLNVVITEFPGWRIYKDFNNARSLTIDYNGLIWITGWNYGIRIYAPELNTIRTITTQNSELPELWVEEIVVVDGSRVWIATDHFICEYHYDLDKWIKVIQIPEDPITNGIPHIYSIELDKNYDLFIGTSGSRNHKYIMFNGADFSYYSMSRVFQPQNMVLHPDGSIFIAGDPGIDVFRYGQISSFDDYPYPQGDAILVIDLLGNVWTYGYRDGLLKYDGTNWEYISTNFLYSPIPRLVNSDGILFGDVHGQIATYDGVAWNKWDIYDTPLKDEPTPIRQMAETPNGDIWMVLDNKLMRYRPSLGEYP